MLKSPSRFLLVVAGTLATAACPSASPQATTHDSAGPPTLVGVPLDSFDADVGVETSCLFEKRDAHPDGRFLILEFLERDVRGDFLGADEWFNLATDCVGHEPGPDSHLVIDGYTVDVVPVNDTLLAGIVRERRIGWVYYDTAGKPSLELKPENTVDTVFARRTRYGWRIVGPALRQHIEIYGARNFALRNRYKDTLEALGFLRASAE